MLTQLRALVALPCCSSVPGQVLGPGNKGHRSNAQPQPLGPSKAAESSRKESYKLAFSQVTL